MHDHRDRPDPKRIALTSGAWILGIVILLVVGSIALGRIIAEPAPLPVEESVATASVVAAAVATEQVEPTPTPEPEPVPVPEPKPAEKPAPKPAPVSKSSGVVVIEAGHQAKGDSSQEPIGPGSSQKKAKVASGTGGKTSGKPESLINLQVALKLRDELESRGVKVVMVRTTQDVNISNSERAAVANRANADLFVRLHCDGADNSTTHGLSTLVPGANQWTGPIVAESGSAGKLVHKAALAATGAADRGVKQRTDLSGFNWSKVPTVLVEMGFMSNPDEDRKLATDAYQLKLAEGIANGVVEYLGR